MSLFPLTFVRYYNSFSDKEALSSAQQAETDRADQQKAQRYKQFSLSLMLIEQ